MTPNPGNHFRSCGIGRRWRESWASGRRGSTRCWRCLRPTQGQQRRILRSRLCCVCVCRTCLQLRYCTSKMRRCDSALVLLTISFIKVQDCGNILESLCRCCLLSLHVPCLHIVSFFDPPYSPSPTPTQPPPHPCYYKCAHQINGQSSQPKCAYYTLAYPSRTHLAQHTHIHSTQACEPHESAIQTPKNKKYTASLAK